MPVRASKGLALRYFAEQWDIPLEHILAAGGSGADEDMMRGNTLAVVVANRHHEELSRLADTRPHLLRHAPLRGRHHSRPSTTTISTACRVPEAEERPTMTDRLLLCTDLDRTLLPNGAAARVAGRTPAVTPGSLATRSASGLSSRAATAPWSKRPSPSTQLPQPDFVIADVGTSIYDVRTTRLAPGRRGTDDPASRLGRDATAHGHRYRCLQTSTTLTACRKRTKQGRFKMQLLRARVQPTITRCCNSRCSSA